MDEQRWKQESVIKQDLHFRQSLKHGNTVAKFRKVCRWGTREGGKCAKELGHGSVSCFLLCGHFARITSLHVSTTCCVLSLFTCRVRFTSVSQNRYIAFLVQANLVRGIYTDDSTATQGTVRTRCLHKQRKSEVDDGGSRESSC